MKSLAEKTYCDACRKETNHGIVSSYETSPETTNDFWWSKIYHIVQCLGCDNISYVTAYTDETLIEYNAFGEEYQHTDYKCYPENPHQYINHSHTSHQAIDFYSVPESIQEIYKQICFAYNQELYLLAGVGLRMLIEGICKDISLTEVENLTEVVEGNQKQNKKDPFSGDLLKKINSLESEKYIVKNQADILHKIRIIGNLSAHGLEPAKRSTIREAICILERIIEQIYVYNADYKL